MASTMPVPVPPPLDQSLGLHKETSAVEQDALANKGGDTARADAEAEPPTHHANGLTDQTSYLPARGQSRDPPSVAAN